MVLRKAQAQANANSVAINTFCLDESSPFITVVGRNKGVARGVLGCPWPPLCKPFFTQTTYNIQVAKTRVHSVWQSVNPPLKNPGYAHEECIFIYFIYIIYLFIYYNLWDEMQKSQRPHTKADPSPPKFKVVVLKPKPWVDFHIRDQNGGRQKNHCYSD